MSEDEVALELTRFIAVTTGLGKKRGAPGSAENPPRLRRSRSTLCCNSLSAAAAWSENRKLGRVRSPPLQSA